MDRLNQLRGEGGGSHDASLDRSQLTSDAYLTADESSAYYSLQNNTTLNTSSKDESILTDSDKIVKSSDNLLPDLSPIRKEEDLENRLKIDDQTDITNTLSDEVHLFGDHDSSYDGHELVIDDKIEEKAKDDIKSIDESSFQKSECTFVDATLVEPEAVIPSKDTEVVLQIDGKNVDAIDIGNGLYLYRKEGEEELAVVQIIDDIQQPTFKFLKVRENSEGNLEVYEEIEVEVPKEVPEKTVFSENISHVPIKDINKIICDSGIKNIERKNISSTDPSNIPSETDESTQESISENKNEVNLNVKVVKYGESRKSPIIGSFTPMAYHSTPNKEGVPLTKTMVEQQLHPNRHSDIVKKTIEVHTDGSKQRILETPPKIKEVTYESSRVTETNLFLNPKETFRENIVCEQSETKKIHEKEDHETEKIISELNIICDNEAEFKKAIVKKEENPTEKLNTNVSIQSHNSNCTYPNKGKNKSLNDDSSHNIIDSKLKKEATVVTANAKVNDKGLEKSNTNVCDKDKEGIPSKESQDKTEYSKLDLTVSQRIESNTQDLVKNEKIDNVTDVEKHDVSNSLFNISNKSNPGRVSQEDISKVNNSNISVTTDIGANLLLHSSSKGKNESNPSHSIGSKKVLPPGQHSDKKLNSNQLIGNKTQSTHFKDFKGLKKVNTNLEVKSTPINNNHAAVPFGQWTEANRQEFLNKIKEAKVPINVSNANQIKQPNDLNRRDILKKIDSQRQSNSASAKAQELRTIAKHNARNEPAFVNKPLIIANTKESGTIETKNKDAPVANHKSKETVSSSKNDSMQDLIDKTIEGIINRVPVKNVSDDANQNVIEENKDANCSNKKQNEDITSLEDIEKKMNELHGIPFIERPAHELPQIHNRDMKSFTKTDSQKVDCKVNKSPLSIKNQEKSINDDVVDDSDDEIIEHEPVTGDIDINKSNVINSIPVAKTPSLEECDTKQPESSIQKCTIITEKEFDRFATRNSNPESCSNPKERCISDVGAGKVEYSKNEVSISDLRTNKNHHRKVPPAENSMVTKNKEVPVKNYHSKLQIAYQSALTAKRQMESPITIIEDKPVKVVFMDSNSDFAGCQSNVQTQELSPSKRHHGRIDGNSITAGDSMDSEISDSIHESKLHDDIKSKSKHQRKQVLTPVDTPDLELIEPSDLGIEFSTKRRKKGEDKADRFSLNVMPKKSYLLARGAETEDKAPKPLAAKICLDQKDTVTAIDNLVKAAELIETQHIQNTQNSTDTPVKRGRGRPRKYPPRENVGDKDEVPSPEKIPRLIEAKPSKSIVSSEEDDDDEIIVKENWTMGIINENLVCPICNKLFRSENVIFKHVKHCTGPSPNRSDTDKRSSSRLRLSHDSDSIFSENSKSDTDSYKGNIKRKSRKSLSNIKVDNDIVLIEDTPIKVKETNNERAISTKADLKTLTLDTSKIYKSKSIKTLPEEDTIVINDTPPEKPRIPVRDKICQQQKTIVKTKSFNNLMCEFCGKKFRQLSYLVSHKIQHKNQVPKNVEISSHSSSSTILSCEICKKEFRKLHHLVQHRIIHNQSNKIRKNSSDVLESKVANYKEKQSEEHSAGFRCEPCDKSFRKLHHLVEHRETHDGINRQKNNSMSQNNAEKQVNSLQCDVCKKSFRKLHHLIEHKEQHIASKSIKLEEKGVKNALSTKDIIHECSLCYMVFPNEHSLNKHFIICQKKKKQNAVKQEKPFDEKDETDDILEAKSEPITHVCKNDLEINTKEEICMDAESVNLIKLIEGKEADTVTEEKETTDQEKIKIGTVSHQNTSADKNLMEIESGTVVGEPEKPIQKSFDVLKTETKGPVKTKISKDKVHSTVTKRRKTSVVSLPVVDDVKSTQEVNDDEDIRYMINPDFSDEPLEENFMKICATKRDSFSIQKNKGVAKRRISTNYRPKIPRLKQTADAAKTVQNRQAMLINEESVPSDDNEIKYSFPKYITKNTEQKNLNRSKTEKRRSLSGIAKRKSLGKIKQVKEVGYRCDCGQLFSSAALLSRHTTLAHTPPRIRRRKSPPPEIDKTVTINRRKSSTASKSDVAKVPPKHEVTTLAAKNDISKPTVITEGIKSANKEDTTKPIVKNEIKPVLKKEPSKLIQKNDNAKHAAKNDAVKNTFKNDLNKEVKKIGALRKSSVNKTEVKGMSDSRKASEVTSNVVKAKLRRTTTHSGVPLPQKMKNLGKI